MRRLARCACVAIWMSVTPTWVVAQDSAPPLPVDTTRPDTAAPMRPAQPSADQLKYLGGLRTSARGIAQLRSGVDRVVRAEASKDATRLKAAGRMLAGLCGTARSFMAQGRRDMQPTVYEDSARVKARRLVVQIDSLIKATPTCEEGGGKAPAQVAATVLGRLRSYEAALLEFRTVVATPVPVLQPTQPQRQ